MKNDFLIQHLLLTCGTIGLVLFAMPIFAQDAEKVQ
jgi:hypothetical protein